MRRSELLKGLSKEQVEKARECHSQEELLELARQEEIDLTDEQLAAISGGGCGGEPKNASVCPNCGHTEIDVAFDPNIGNSRSGYRCRCKNCYLEWISQ